MEKYLFTDGTNVVREVQSDAELQKLIQSSPDTARVRIWIFNSSEWISFTEFNRRRPAKPVVTQSPATDRAVREKERPAPKKTTGHYGSFVKLAVVLTTMLTIFLIYNFTRLKWHKASALAITAARPGNVPVLNIDSLLFTIETLRRQKLDKITATNLRIRNTWPDRVQLQLTTDRDTSLAGSKFYNIEFTIDNSTGYQLDEAVATLINWKAGQPIDEDTVQFKNIGYTSKSRRDWLKEYRGDSLSVSFISLRSKAFNFCWEAGKESNYGNPADRWFCKD